MAISNAAQATGSVTAAGVVCSLSSTGSDGVVVILDGSAVATSTITVAVQVLNPATGTYLTPTAMPSTSGSVNMPITLTNATTQVLVIPGGFPGIQVNVTSFGTATGTFKAAILTY